MEGAPVTERARGVGLQERQAATARSIRLRHDFMLSRVIDGNATATSGTCSTAGHDSLRNCKIGVCWLEPSSKGCYLRRAEVMQGL